MISVLIPWDPRTDCPWRRANFAWLMNRWRSIMYPIEVCINTRVDTPFNRSAARNDAFSKATGDYLVVADADAMFDSDQINIAIEMVKATDTWVMPFANYYNLTRETTKGILLADCTKSTRELELPPEEYEHLVTDSPGGIRVLSREMWGEVGGFDERFIGWGYEDDAFRTALNVIVGQEQRLQGCDLYHLWHPVSPTDGFESPTIKQNRKLFQRYKAARSPATMRKVLP